MTAPTTLSATTDPYTKWGLKDWIAVLHNASAVSADDPRYGSARQVMAEAMIRISDLNDQATAADKEQLKPGAIPAFIVAFGNGASLGAVSKLNEGSRVYLQNAPTGAKVVGNIAGMLTLGGIATPLIAGLSPIAGGAVIGGGLGTVGGAINTEGSPVTGGLVGGTLGAVTGGVGGKVAKELIPIARQVGRNVSRLFSRSAPGPSVVGATGRVPGSPGTVEHLANQFGVSVEQIRNPSPNVAVRQAYRQRVTSRPLAPSAADQIQSIENSMGRPLSQAEKDVVLRRWAQRAGQPTVPLVEPISGTGGRGFSVSGTRATPAIPPEQPTLAEMSGMANLQMPGRSVGNPSELPTGRGATLPFYSRGGAIEQSIGPGPSVSPRLPDPTQPVISDWIIRAQAGDPQAIEHMKAIFGLLQQ